jgi:predicted MPP superfamily phosphohydrolase
MESIEEQLERRLGRRYARRRLALEEDPALRTFRRRRKLLHLENQASLPRFIRTSLRLVGLYRRGLVNATRVRLRENEIALERLPPAFDGFSLLHISDLHADMNLEAMDALVSLVGGLSYDICVMTGDYRGRTRGPFAAALEGVGRLRAALGERVYAVLGNHDSIRMVPPLEALGIRVLLNECEVLSRGSERIHLAGIDDAHYFQADNIEKAAAHIPEDEFAILLSHTPEICPQAAHAGFDLLLAGHTHGGQICLPGGIPVTLEAVLPRRLGRGGWRYQRMAGYTSVGVGATIVPVRFNCPPEVTLHRLRRAAV